MYLKEIVSFICSSEVLLNFQKLMFCLSIYNRFFIGFYLSVIRLLYKSAEVKS